MFVQALYCSVSQDMTPSPLSNKAREMRITITPNPTSADADDDFGFTTTISFFQDGKKYNPQSGNDE